MARSLRFELRSRLTVPVDGARWWPALNNVESATEAARIRVSSGRDWVELGELFHITPGTDTPEPRWDWSGDLRAIGGFAAGLSSGRVWIEGEVGTRLGAHMSGGEIRLRGNAGDDVGTEMSGGIIAISGRAGDRVGGCGGLGVRGLNGGWIAVAGDVGRDAGVRMRRGGLLIGGEAQGQLGWQMLAGTICCRGLSQDWPGGEMVRGSLLLDNSPLQPPPANRFRLAGEFPALPWMAIAQKWWSDQVRGWDWGPGERVWRELFPSGSGRWQLWSGDWLAEGQAARGNSVAGKGEVWVGC